MYKSDRDTQATGAMLTAGAYIPGRGKLGTCENWIERPSRRSRLPRAAPPPPSGLPRPRVPLAPSFLVPLAGPHAVPAIKGGGGYCCRQALHRTVLGRPHPLAVRWCMQDTHCTGARRFGL